MFRTTHDAASRDAVKAVIRAELNLVAGDARRAQADRQDVEVSQLQRAIIIKSNNINCLCE
jgi:hypothetical protein